MPNGSSSPFKLIWQIFLVFALVAVAWVLGQVLPAGLPGLKGMAAPSAGQSKTSATERLAGNVRFYALPRVGDSAALNDINTRVAAAQKEVIVVARQMAATSLLTNLKNRAQAGVSVVTLLSPDTTADFARSRLFQWMRDNQVRNVYRDVLTSASHIIVIDSQTIILSDLPFSQRSYEAANEAAAGASVIGFVYVIDDARAAAELASSLRARALTQNKIL